MSFDLPDWMITTGTPPTDPFSWIWPQAWLCGHGRMMEDLNDRNENELSGQNKEEGTPLAFWVGNLPDRALLVGIQGARTEQRKTLENLKIS